MTNGLCAVDVCPNSTLASLIRGLCGQLHCCREVVVGSNPNQAWNAWNSWRVGALLWWHVDGIQRHTQAIRATPGPPGPDLWPVFGPRNSSFSITRSLL